MMSSNTLGNTDFNPINGAVPPPKGKATLPKADKIKLTQSQPDKFERATSPRKTTDDAETTATVTEPKKDVLPLIFSGLALAGTVGLGLFTLFKKPEEATKTAEKLVDDVVKKQIKTLEETVEKQGRELAEKASNADLTEVQNSIQQTVDSAVQTATEGIQKSVDNLVEQKNTIQEAVLRHNETIQSHASKLENQDVALTANEKAIKALQAKVDLIPMIGGNIVVHPEIKALFTAPEKLTGLQMGVDRQSGGNPIHSELQHKINAFTTEAVIGVEEGETGVDVKGLIKLAFNHLQLEGTPGHPGEMKALAKALNLTNENVADPYKHQLKALATALETVSRVYEGHSFKNETDGRLIYPIVSRKALVERANGVLNVAKTNDIEATKTAQSELMTWLENIFTKTKPEIFEMNTNGKKPLKTLPAPHSDSDWVRDQKLLEGDKPLAELTQTLLGSGFTMAEHPYMMGDVSTLSDAVNALRRALMKEQDYFTLEEGVVLNPPKGSSRSELAQTLNRIAKTLISIDDKAIEGGLVPLWAVEVDPKKPYLPDEMWNARLNGDEEGVKTVTQQMFEKLRKTLFDSHTIRMPLGGTTKPQVAEIFNQRDKSTNLEKFSELANQFDDNSITSKPSPEVMIKQLFDELAGEVTE